MIVTNFATTLKKLAALHFGLHLFIFPAHRLEVIRVMHKESLYITT